MEFKVFMVVSIFDLDPKVEDLLGGEKLCNCGVILIFESVALRAGYAKYHAISSTGTR